MYNKVKILNQEIPTIYVGKKPLSIYLAQCFEIVDLSKTNKVQLRIEGMGKNIVKVVDLINFLKRFLTKQQVEVVKFDIDLVPKKEVHGLPKHVSKLSLLVEVSSEE